MKSHDIEPISTIDVIIPVRNEAKYLDTLLGQVINQDYKPTTIYVVVAPSDDDTLARARRHAERHTEIVVLDNPRLTPANAMNIALGRVKSDAWIRIDGHTEVPLDLLSVLRDEMNRHQVACVGPMLRSGSQNPTQQAIGLAMSSPIGVGSARFRTGRGGSGPTDAVAFGLYRRTVTDSVGLYETALDRNEDDQYNTRLRALGHTMWLTDRVFITYYPRSSYRELARQYYYYGFWRMRSTFNYRNRLRYRQAAPAALIAGLAAAAWSIAHAPNRRSAWIVPGSYAGLLVVQVLRSLPVAPSAITALNGARATATMHLAYGFGTLVGLGVAIQNRVTSSRGRYGRPIRRGDERTDVA